VDGVPPSRPGAVRTHAGARSEGGNGAVAAARGKHGYGHRSPPPARIPRKRGFQTRPPARLAALGCRAAGRDKRRGVTSVEVAMAECARTIPERTDDVVEINYGRPAAQ